MYLNVAVASRSTLVGVQHLSGAGPGSGPGGERGSARWCRSRVTPGQAGRWARGAAIPRRKHCGLGRAVGAGEQPQEHVRLLCDSLTLKLGFCNLRSSS